MSILPIGFGSSDEVDIGDNIANSLMLDSGASQYLIWTPASAGSRTTWTFNKNVKRAKLGTQQLIFQAYPGGTNNTFVIFTASDTIDFLIYSSSTVVGRLTTTQVFRDPTAHLNVHIVLDTTNAVAADRMRLYVGGVRVTSFSVNINPALNVTGYINSLIAHTIGRNNNGGVDYFDGYLSAVHFIDGQALDPSSFGRISADTGQWVPKNYTGTYGTNGFKLDFTNSGALGTDSSGNGNNWTLNGGITSANQYTDTPTNNYCVLNQLNPGRSTITKGNLTASGTTDLPTISPTSGTWYFEIAGVSKTWTPPAAFPAAAGAYNFGARPFSNTATAPTLCTANLPEGTAAAPATFLGNASADGSYVAMNGTPETATINSNAVTWGTHADRTAGGMKLRTSSASYNAAGSNTLSCTFRTPNRKSVQKYQTAKGNL